MAKLRMCLKLQEKIEKVGQSSEDMLTLPLGIKNQICSNMVLKPGQNRYKQFIANPTYGKMYPEIIGNEIMSRNVMKILFIKCDLCTVIDTVF